MVVEFDGLPHYTSPLTIQRDFERTKFYESYGYQVVRIPFFIQFTNHAVKQLFGVIIEEELFDKSVPSLGPKGGNTLAFYAIKGYIVWPVNLLNSPSNIKPT